MNKRLFVGVTILVVIVILVFVGYQQTKKERINLPGLIKTGEKENPDIYPIDQRRNKFPFENNKIETPTIPLEDKFGDVYEKKSPPYQLLFKEKYLYLDLDYPLLYVYEPNEGLIKYLNLSDESYKEIYRTYGLREVLFSLDKTKLILKTDSGNDLLDIKKDSFYKFPFVYKNFVFLINDLIVYLNDNQKISYLAFWEEGKIDKIRNLGLLNPEFVSLNNKILIYENEGNSPVFILDPKKSKSLEVFLEAKSKYSLLPNREGNLIFVSYYDQDNGWQGEIITLEKKLKYSFSWGTAREKCSFDDVLICSLPSDLNNFNINDWRLLEENYDNKLVIYNPKDNQLKEINLEGTVDLVKPKLTPLGIVFWNRWDSQFYLIKSEKISF